MTVVLRDEHDCVAARGAARHLARLLGFEYQDQVRVATAVSELARAAIGRDDGPGAAARFSLSEEVRPQRLVIGVTSPYLADAATDTGSAAGSALIAARRLLDDYGRTVRQGDDTIALAARLPATAPLVDAARASAIGAEIRRLDAESAGGYLGELKQQNRELSSTLLELERKQKELERLNAELADTNRGVMALYAELDERAEHLRRADELKTKFLSYMSHEFRTPLNSILALSSMLLECLDGPLTPEQAKQVSLIRDSSSELFELVSDLLDLAKVEAGKAALSVGRFSVEELFGALRGMARPLARSPSVAIEFDQASEIPPVLGDEGKVAQVLRNFISNALKFTESGTVRVGARVLKRGDVVAAGEPALAQESVLFYVADTGIGIARQDQATIFEEFTQLPHSLQKSVRGTGLGLPLCRKLASLMSGQVWVDSDVGEGSTFYLLVPRFYRPVFEPVVASRLPPVAVPVADSRAAGVPLLVVSDLADHRQDLERLFRGSGFAPVPAAPSDVSADLLAALRPRAAVAHAGGAGSSAGEHPPTWLRLLRQAGIAVIETPAAPQDPVAPQSSFGRRLVAAVQSAVLRDVLRRVLVVDDDPEFLHIITRRLEPYCREVVTLTDSVRALSTVADGNFDCAVLDLMMPSMDGFALLNRLRDRTETARLPVVVCSSKTPTADEWRLLQQIGAAFVPKSELDPDGLGRALLDAWSRTPGPGLAGSAAHAEGMR